MFGGKKIVIAGAGGLLGSSLVGALIKSEAKVVATDVNLETMLSRLEDKGIDVLVPELMTQELDLTDEDAVQMFFMENEEITGAVNCTYPRNKLYGASFFDVSLSSFNENLAIHLGSAFLFSQQCAAYFKRHQTPFSLINLSSIYGVVTPRFGLYENTSMTMPVEYAAIKSAILHLSRYVTAFVNDSNFRVNTVSPGGFRDAQPESFLDRYKQQTLGKGMLDIDDVLGAILFLLSDDSKYINGQNIIVDDGFTL